MKLQMKWTSEFQLFCSFFFATIFVSPGAFAADEATLKSVPELPTYALLDESRKLKAPMVRALERVLTEHSTLTGQPVFVAVFESKLEEKSGGEDFSAYSLRVFDHWKNAFGDRSDVVLLAVDLRSHQGRIEVGYQVEPMLGESKTRAIIRDFLVPELSAGNPGRAVSLALMEILKSLESPLVQSGEGQKILIAGGFTGSWQPTVRAEAQRGWGLWFLLGFGLLIVVIFRVMDVEAVYTGRGWVRVRPWKMKFRKSQPGLITGGGSCGSW